MDAGVGATTVVVNSFKRVRIQSENGFEDR